MSRRSVSVGSATAKSLQLSMGLQAIRRSLKVFGRTLRSAFAFRLQDCPRHLLNKQGNAVRAISLLPTKKQDERLPSATDGPFLSELSKNRQMASSRRLKNKS